MKISSFDVQNKFLIYRLPSILMKKSMYQDIEQVFSIIHNQEINGVFVDFSNVDTIITDGLSILNNILKGILLLGASCSISSVPSHLAQPLSEYLEKLPKIQVVTNFSEFVSKSIKEKTDKEFYSDEILQKIYGKDKTSGKFLIHIDELTTNKKSIESSNFNKKSINSKNQNSVMNNLIKGSEIHSKNKTKIQKVKHSSNLEKIKSKENKEKEIDRKVKDNTIINKKGLENTNKKSDDKLQKSDHIKEELELKETFTTYYNNRSQKKSKQHIVFTNYYSLNQEKKKQKRIKNQENNKKSNSLLKL